VKYEIGNIGGPAISELFGNIAQGAFGMFITLGTYTKQVAESKSNLRLLDGDDVIFMVLRHYEKLDARYKGLIPLKRVYNPEEVES
jgi:restriction system protein